MELPTSKCVTAVSSIGWLFAAALLRSAATLMFSDRVTLTLKLSELLYPNSLTQDLKTVPLHAAFRSTDGKESSHLPNREIVTRSFTLAVTGRGR